MNITMQEDADAERSWLEKTGGYAKDMTLLDYFAGQVLQAVMSDTEMFKYMTDGKRGPADELIAGCYTIAAKMLKGKDK